MATSLGLILAACTNLVLADIKFIDLTHTFGKNNIYWPINPPFNFSLAFKMDLSPDVVVVSNYFQTPEHFGTHMDAPYHFCPTRKKLHELTLDQLSGPGVVLDFQKEAEKNIDFQLTPDHIIKWEKENGQIPFGAIVLQKYGWNKYWPDWNKVFNTENIMDTSSYHWPGASPEASDWLAKNRKIRALGSDTPSPEYGQTSSFPVHVNLLCDHGLIILENVGNIAALPITGTRVFIAPVKLENGSGIPVRLFATMGSGSCRIKPGNVAMLAFLVVLVLMRLL